MAIKSIKKNYIYNLSYQILVLLLPLVTTPYLARVFGADGVGTYSYIESVCSYFTLFATLGLTVFGRREISYVRDNKKNRSIVFWETNLLRLGSTLSCILVYVVFSLTQKNSSLYLVLIFNIFGVLANISWFFQGMEEFGKIVLRDVVFKLLNTAYIFIFIKNKDDLILYLFGTAFFGFLSNASLWLCISKYINKPVWSELKPFKHLTTVISLFVPSLAITIYTVLDKIMLVVLTGSYYENGYYEQAIKLSKIALTVITALGTAIVPRIAYYFEKGDGDMVKKYMYQGYRFVLFLGIPMCFGLIAVSDTFIPWFLGEDYYNVIPLLKISSLLILAIGISNLTGIHYLVPTKRQNTLTVTVFIGAITNFVLNMVLINYFQAMGAVIASVITEYLITGVQLFIVRNEISIYRIIKSGKNYYIAGILMLIILKCIPHYKISPLDTVIFIVMGVFIYFFILVLLKDEFLLSNLKSILKKITGRNV